MKLKNDFKYIYEITKQSYNTQKFLLVFSLSIMVSIYCIFLPGFDKPYIDSFIEILSNSNYIMCLSIIVLINTLLMYETFNKNLYYIIRLKSKEDFLIQLIKLVVFSNIIVVLLNMTFILIGLNLLAANENPLNIFQYYNIPKIVYMIFLIIKVMIILVFISIINSLLFKIVNNKIIIILNIILLIINCSIPITNYEISSITEIPLFIFSHISRYTYSSFIFEVLSFSLYSGLIYILCTIVFKFVKKYMRDVII